MESEKDLVVLQYRNKLQELYSLISNPVGLTQLLENLSNSKEAQDFLLENEISNEHLVLLHSIKGMESAGSVYHLIKSYSKLQPEGNDNSLKRKSTDFHDKVIHKLQKVAAVDFPSRLMPAAKTSTATAPRSENLRAQIKTMEQKTNEFLNKSIDALEVISLPENYPTEVHSVLSLAEFYYLTQTLPLIKLLPGSHKTLQTENFELALLEGKIAVLHSRIEELKRQKKWSLRQPVRYYDPFLYAKKNKMIQNHTWDNIIQEGSWMATDFKESLKFKKACCFLMAQAVQDYWSYGKVMCIKPKPVVFLELGQSTITHLDVTSLPDPLDVGADLGVDAMENELEIANESVSDDMAGYSNADKLPRVESIDVSKLIEAPNPSDEIVPPPLPEFSPEDLRQFGVEKEHRGPFKAYINLDDLKNIDQSIIKTLPKVTAFRDPGTSNLKGLTSGETSIIPVSRMLHPFEDDKGWHKIILKDGGEPSKSGNKNALPEYQKGLFGVQSHRRINFLRPPKPPLIKNIEYRLPTIWLPQDDKCLIHYVAEYCFNWDLIADNLQASSATLKRYESNIERRTPWQCFERYIQLNEKFQFSDMKGHNSYQAQQWLEHAHRAQSTTKRRISPLGVGNDSIQRGHRRLRWASMFDAIRKSMKKRETASAKANNRRGNNQPEYSSTSSTNEPASFANNSANAVKRASDRTPTPNELSKLKYDRDKSIQEAYLNQQATKIRMAAAVKQQKNADSPISGLSPSVGGSKDLPGAAPGTSGRRMSQLPARGQAVGISRGSAQRPPGSVPTQRPAGIQASQALSAQAQQQQQAKQLLGNLKRPTSPNGTPYTVEQVQKLLQLQKQKRLIQQQNQPGKDVSAQSSVGSPQSSASGQKFGVSSPNKGLSSQNYATTGHSNAAGNALAATSLQGSLGGMMQGKRATMPPKSRIQFAPAQVSAIINSIQQKNPNLTKDQVTKLAASYLANLQQQQNKAEQQHQQTARAQSAGEGSARAQQNLQTRQAHLARQRLVAQSSPGTQGKDPDGQTMSRLQYEERKKLMMQQGGSQYGRTGSSSQNSIALSPIPDTNRQTQNRSSGSGNGEKRN